MTAPIPSGAYAAMRTCVCINLRNVPRGLQLDPRIGVAVPSRGEKSSRVRIWWGMVSKQPRAPRMEKAAMWRTAMEVKGEGRLTIVVNGSMSHPQWPTLIFRRPAVCLARCHDGLQRRVPYSRRKPGNMPANDSTDIHPLPVGA
jgi:hypothetical protein